MKVRLFPRRLVGVITAFFLLPISNVYADTYSDDSTFWRWWYVEQITDQMTDGNGADAENIDDTYNGSTAGNYIYNTTGITSDDVKEYVKNQYDNAVGYVDKSFEQYSNMIDDIWNSSVDAATKASYKAQKAIRETVDTAGNAVVDVSSSNYWNNVYNDIFNNGSYADQYIPSDNESYTGEVNGHTFSVNWFGVCSVPANATIDNPASDVVYIPSDCRFASSLNHLADSEFWGNTVGLSFTVDGNQYYEYRATSFQGWFGGFDGIAITGNTYRFNFHWVGRSGTAYNDSITIYFTSTPTNQGTQFEPVLQPKQVGFVTHNGIKYPVFTDPSLNPFKVNDDGTVTWDDGSGDEHVYVNPKELTDDGWLDILENVDNNDSTENPYNPFGRPWNTQDDGSALGGFFGNLVKDIGSVFKGLADTLANLFKNLIDGILNALKSLFDIDFDSIASVELDVNFNIITVIWQKLLEILGVS